MRAVQVPPSPETKITPTIQRLGLTAVVLVLAIALMLGFPLGAAGFVTVSFAGSAAMFFYLWRRAEDWLAAAMVAAGLGGLYRVTGAPLNAGFDWDLTLAVALVGMAGLVVLFYRSTGEDKAGQRRLLALIGNIGLIPALCMGSTVAVLLDPRITPRTYDGFLYVFDRSFGFNPSFLMGVAFHNHAALRFLSVVVYNNLPVNLCLFCALWLRRRPAGAPDVRPIFAALGIVGFALYHICPAAGPIHLFGNAFPFHPPPVSGVPMETVAIPDARNAMPSLHVAWSLLMVYSAWFFRSRLLRIYAIVCLILTAVATLGLGEHYAIDLIVSVPLSVAIQIGCWGPGRRWLAVGVLMAMVVAWLVVLRTSLAWHAQPLVSWGATGITLLASAALYGSGGRTANGVAKPGGA
jgi:hypothetical protein